MSTPGDMAMTTGLESLGREPTIDSVVDLLSLQTHARADQPAILSSDEECTFAELERRVIACAHGLAALGVRKGSVVGLLCTNRIEWVIAALGAIAAGGRVAAFNTWAKQWDLDHLLGASNCEVLVSLSGFGSTDLQPALRQLVPEAWESDSQGWRSTRYPSLREIVMIDGPDGSPGVRSFDDLGAIGTAAVELPAPNRNAVALILYTSGSTARPKAVPLQQGTALEHGYDVGVRMGVRCGDRVWLPVPLFWSYGGANALMVALTHGCTLVLQETFDAGEALDLIEGHRCQVGYTLPNITAALLAHPRFSIERVASLERGMTIGSRADVAAAATGLAMEGICNAYGSTEIYGCCSATPHNWPLERKLASQGPTLPRIEVTITDPESGEILPADEIGEITVSGQVAVGYLGQQDSSAAAFDKGGEYRTGDLGHLDPAGNLAFSARATEMIKSGGINIAPAEVEEFLLTHPDVVEAAVSGAEDAASGQVVVAFVRLAPAATSDEAGLKAFCRQQIASFKVPALIVIVDNPFPSTSTGKLARSVLHEMARDQWQRTSV